MTWKKKERPLTPEEAIALAKKELAPYWFNTEPLLATVRTEHGASVLPLNSNFVSQTWLYGFVDPTDFAGERALETIREWHRRYGTHDLGFIIVFRANAAFAKSGTEFLRKIQIPVPAMVDVDGLFSTAFGISAWPAAVVQGGTQEIARGSGANWLEDLEEKIQVFLRQSDPGLSLPLPFEAVDSVVGQVRVDFGKVRGKPVASLGNYIQLDGNWNETDECISTSDPKATATIMSPSPVFALIAQSNLESQTTKISIQLMEGTISQDWIFPGVTIDEVGFAQTKVQHYSLYPLLKDLPATRRRILLRFPDADTVPVNIFGLRFGSRK